MWSRLQNGYKVDNENVSLSDVENEKLKENSADVDGAEVEN